MRGFHYIWVAFIGFLTLASCQEIEEPELTSNEVVFYLNGDVDGNSFLIQAGEEDYFMHTSYSQDSVDVYEFYGRLTSTNCNGNEVCPGIGISFRDNQTSSTNGTSNIEASVTPKNYLFRSQVDSSLSGYRVQFTDNSYAQNNVSYFWDFGDGSTSTDPNPEHIYDASFAPSVIACLTVTDLTTSSSSTICNVINLTGDCYATFTYSFANDSTLQALNSVEFGTSPFTYLWNFGSGYLPLSSQPTPDFTTVDSMRICVQITDANGCVSSMCRYVVAPNPQIDCAAGFEWTKSTVNTPNLLDLSEVSLNYTDDAGKVWTSNSYDQPNSSYFTVSDVGNYKENNAGEPTKHVAITGNCLLYGDSQYDFVMLTISEGSIAVAYPK